jgi:hypothetical protein
MCGSLFGPPNTLRIPNDDHRFEHVGYLADGTQFMACVTGAFPDSYRGHPSDDAASWRRAKRWMAVLHLFDADGNHKSSEAKLGGFDIDAGEKAFAELARMLRSLKEQGATQSDIWVRQFSIQIDSVTHSLLYSAEQPEADCPVLECVMLEPRDIMFHPPWDSGQYST